jgi:hypothetical protein
MLTVKRMCLALTKEDLRELEFLVNHFGESKSQVIRRALIKLYNNIYEDNKLERNNSV